MGCGVLFSAVEAGSRSRDYSYERYGNRSITKSRGTGPGGRFAQAATLLSPDGTARATAGTRFCLSCCMV